MHLYLSGEVHVVPLTIFVRLEFSARGFWMVCSTGRVIGSNKVSATTVVAEGNNNVDVLEAVRRLTWARDTGRTLDGKEEVVSACNLRFQ